MCSWVAVTTPPCSGSRYSNSHQYCLPITLICIASGSVSESSKTVRTDGTAMNRRITAGISVHAISSRVLPATCLGSSSGSSEAFARKRNIA